MRRTIAILGMFMLGAVGCKHTCGKCDCGPATGDAALYAPMNGYVTPQVGSTPPGAPGAAAPMMIGPGGTTPEVIGTPKSLPPSK